MKQKKNNIMGSQVQKGFQCKPTAQNFDLNRPMMSYRFHLFFCEGGRCRQTSRINAGDLRELIKRMNLHNGKNRIKITRNLCFGACRFKTAVVLYSFSGEFLPIWLKQTHEWSEQRWKDFFTILIKSPQDIFTNFSSSIIYFKEF